MNKELIQLINNTIKQLNNLEEELFNCEELETINKKYYEDKRNNINETINLLENKLKEIE